MMNVIAALRVQRLSGFLAALGGVAVAIVAVELVVRGGTHVRGACHPRCITQYDATLGWTHTRLSSGRHKQEELGIDVVYRIDARGVRKAPITVHDAATRTVVVGDSNGFGWGVDEDQSFAAQLVQAGVATVLNLSVSGYGTDQEYLRYLTEGAAFRPELVVVQVTPNDFDDIQSSLVGGRPKPRFTLEEGMLRLHNVPVRVEPNDTNRLAGGWLPLPVWRWLARHSYLFDWIAERSYDGRVPDGPRPRFSTGSIALFRAIVSGLRDSAREQNADVVILHASSKIGEPQADAIPLGVQVVDLSEAFASGSPALFADGLHWNQRGHRLAAARLAEWIAAHKARRTAVSHESDPRRPPQTSPRAPSMPDSDQTRSAGPGTPRP